jgi:(p)ppGpp synthase/HD superfamily hydrolase
MSNLDRLAEQRAETSGAPIANLSPRFIDALTFALGGLAAHEGRGVVPNPARVLGVASLVLSDGGDEDAAIAAVLCAAVGEDTDLARLGESVRRTSGAAVAEAIRAYTEVVAGVRGRPTTSSWGARRQRAIDVLADAGPMAAQIMLADHLHALRAIVADLVERGPRMWDRIDAGRDDHLWYYRGLAEAAARHAQHPRNRLAREFLRAVELFRQAVGEVVARHAAPPGPKPSEGVDTCGSRHPMYGRACRRPRDHRGLHKAAPLPGDFEV